MALPCDTACVVGPLEGLCLKEEDCKAELEFWGFLLK